MAGVITVLASTNVSPILTVIPAAAKSAYEILPVELSSYLTFNSRSSVLSLSPYV